MPHDIVINQRTAGNEFSVRSPIIPNTSKPLISESDSDLRKYATVLAPLAGDSTRSSHHIPLKITL